MDLNSSGIAGVWKGNQHRYGPLARLLHWGIALLLLGQIGLGLYMVELSYYDPFYNRAFDLHKSLGVLTFGLILLRLVWAVVDVRPPISASLKSWEKKAAKAVHHILYLLMVVIPVTGYLVSTADGRGVEVFGLFEVLALLPGEKGREEWTGDLHFYLALTLLGLVVVHTAAALKHHFVERGDALKKML